MVRHLGANASRRVGRALLGVKCPWCRAKYLHWSRRHQRVSCGVCGGIYTISEVLPKVEEFLGLD